MPDTNFVFDQDDERRIVGYIFDRGGWMIPDLNPTPDLIRIDCWEMYQMHSKEKLYFILCYEFSTFPLEVRRIDGGFYEGKYSVRQRVGGPTIDFYCGRAYIKDDIRWLPSSNFSYYSSFERTDVHQMEKAPPAQVAFYRDLVKFSKCGARLVAGSKQRYWVAPGAYQALQRGSQLNIKGLSPVE